MADAPREDEAKIELSELLGKHVLIGLTFEDEGGGNRVLQQMHGAISRVDVKTGIHVELAGQRAGHTYTLPPDTRAVRQVPPGEYRLRSSGEIVTNPDVLATWIVVRRRSE